MNDHHNEFIEKNKRTQPISSSSAATTIIDDPFSSLSLLDPSHEISQSSKEAGRIAGRTASFNEGRSIGRTKGWEVGLELGYVFNFCSELLNGLKLQQQREIQQRNDEQQSSNIDNGDDDNDDGNKNGGHMQQSARNKSSSSSSNRTTSRLDRCSTLARDIVTLIEDFPPPQHLLDNLDDDDDDDDVATENNQPSEAKLDISTSIQRIRAKFKLLSVLLKTGQSYDIKRILELKGVRSDERNNDNNGVDVDANVVKSVVVQKDDDGVVVAKSRNNMYDVEHKPNGGDDW